MTESEKNRPIADMLVPEEVKEVQDLADCITPSLRLFIIPGFITSLLKFIR